MTLLNNSFVYSNNKIIESYTIQVGQTIDINSINEEAFSISDASIVQLNGTNVTGLKAGMTTIKSYSTISYWAYEYAHKLTAPNINNNIFETNDYYLDRIITINVVDVKTISILPFIEMSVGEAFTYSPIITDREAATTFTWTSSNPAVAEIDENGSVTALAHGKAVITCAAANGVFTQGFVHVVGAESVRGDMNGDGKVTATDAVQVIDIILEKE